jgi:hypothetical protein
VPVIGFLAWGFPRLDADYVVAFRNGLADAGYIESQNVEIEYRWGNTQSRALWPLAAELVHRPVAAIVAISSSSAAYAAKAATSIIPIVFVYGGDPVRGLVASLSRPWANPTGVASFFFQHRARGQAARTFVRRGSPRDDICFSVRRATAPPMCRSSRSAVSIRCNRRPCPPSPRVLTLRRCRSRLPGCFAARPISFSFPAPRR